MLTVDDLDNLRDLAKRQPANHAEKKILAAVEEIVRLQEAGVGYSQQTVNAIVKEREELRQENKQLRENVEDAARLSLHVMKQAEDFFKAAERLRGWLREMVEDFRLDADDHDLSRQRAIAEALREARQGSPWR